MDDQFRAAVRAGDVARVRAIASRAPVSVLRAALDGLLSEKRHLDAMIGAVDAVAPKCWCGEVGEPRCPKHEDALRRFEQMRAGFAGLGILDKWLDGALVLERDLKGYLKAWREAGAPDHADDACYFPGCPRERPVRWITTCDAHEGFPIVIPYQDKSKERGR